MDNVTYILAAESSTCFKFQGIFVERACHDVPTFNQEDNWGALCHWKDLWQEETVRIVTQRLASRAKQLPEATYANDMYV